VRRLRPLRLPVARRDDDRPLCDGCWEPPARVCSRCGRLGPAAAAHGAGWLCQGCYRQHARPRRPCGRCGEIRIVGRRAADGEPDLCQSCRDGRQQTCSTCGRTKRCRPTPSGTWVCSTCRPRASDTCSRCQRSRPVHARWPIGPVCNTCYTTVLTSPGECPQCTDVQPLIGRDDGGTPICGRCAGHHIDYTCQSCGRAERAYETGKCARCVLTDRLRALLAGPDGAVSPQLAPVLDALAEVPQPRSVIRWIQTSPNAALLARLAADGQPLTHDLLDGLPPGRYESYVRQILVHAGVLPERHEDVERIPAWLDQTLATRPPRHARMIRPFVHWSLLRRARRRAALRRYPASANRWLKTQITTALQLLTWLDKRDQPLAQLTQPDLDAWLATGNSDTYSIRYFLNWASGRGLAPKLTVPTRPRQQPAQFLDEATRWQQLRRCLTDETMPLDVRAAGALILLFGLTIIRIRHLTTEHLTMRGDHVLLAAGDNPVVLPPRLADLLNRLAAGPPTPFVNLANRAHRRWLFPGLVPGRPTGAGLGKRLQLHDIDARTARNGALIALAADLPAPVLAQMLGMHTVTAVRWADLAQKDWTSYLAARSNDRTSAGTAHSGQRSGGGPGRPAPEPIREAIPSTDYPAGSSACDQG
jgi:hypothetical protein